MSRTLSFGYNAIAALSEMVVDRLVGVSFADGTIDEIITRKFTLSSASGTMHALISKPEVELGAGAKDRFWLSLGFHAVLEFPAPPNLFNLADGDWIKARVRIYAKLSNSGAKLDPDFSSLSPYDIKVDNLTSNNKTLQSVAPLFLVKELLKALASPSFDKLEVDLSFDPESLASDSMDVASLDGPPPADHDELSLALYDSSSSQQTRGKVGAVKPILSTNQSFAIRISRATFDALIKKESKRRRKTTGSIGARLRTS
jgi:hypothetical protein